MRQLRFLRYDVFTDRPFTGNQLAVLVVADDLSTGTMQAIAQEMNYSESTFVLPATGSAAGPLGVYLVRHGRLSPDEHGDSRLHIAQGVEMGRASTIEVAITGGADDIREARVGGEAVLVAEGTLTAPAAAAAQG
ncbi:MAG: PhzF family phenazine biosynthesis protein, partial [Ktedonobacterales bacterium]